MKRLYNHIFFPTTVALLLLSGVALSQTITATDVPNSICANESLTISYTASVPITSGTAVTAELSDITGSFAIPTPIGADFADGTTTGTIYVYIPTTTTLSPTSAYRIRVTSGGLIPNDNGANIIINCTTRDYYWIGGAGNWSDLNHWEYTTDDVTYTSPADVLPTLNDNVNFDGLSFPSGGQLTFDVTAECNDFYMDPSVTTGPVLWGDGNGPLNVYGDFELAPGVYRDLYYLYFRSEKKNVYVNFGDNLFQKDPNTTWWKGRYIYFNAGGSWDIDSDMAAEYIRGYGGTIYTNDYTINVDFEFYISGSNLDAGSSIINASGLSIYGISNLLDNSTANLNTNKYGDNPYIYGTQTYGSVNINSGVCQISQGNTFGALSLINGGGMSLNSGTTQTILNTFTAQGGGRSQMAVITSQQPGSTATIDVNSAFSVIADYVNIQDNIIDDGGGGVYSATNAIDGGNNTNWSFSLLTPLEYYWVGGTGDWSDASHWVTSGDGGATTAPVVEGPGPIDNVNFNANSFPGSGQITVDQTVTIMNMTWEAGSGTTKPTLYGDWNNYLNIRGDLTMDNGVRRRVSRLLFDSSQGVNNISMADNYNAYGDIYFDGGGIWNLLDSLYVGSSMIIRDGTLNTNNNSVTSQYGITIESDLSIVNWGSSLVYLMDGFYVWANTPTLNFGTSVFYFGNDWNGRTRIDGYSVINFNSVIATTSPMEIDNSNNFNSLEISPGQKLTLRNGSTQTITGNLKLTGTRSALVTLDSDSPGLPATLSVIGAAINTDFISVKDNIIDNGIATNVSASNAVDNGGNTGWTFSPIIPYDFRWISGAGNWSDMSHWEYSTDNGNTYNPASDLPGPVDNIFFTANSIPNGGEIILDGITQCNNMTWEAGSGAGFPTMRTEYPNNELTIYGSLQLADGVNRNIDRINFTSDLPGNTISMADNLYTWGDIDFTGAGEWTLLDSLAAAYLNLRGSGILNTNNQPIAIQDQIYLDWNATSTINWGTSNVYMRRIYFDSQNMIFNGNSATFYFNGEDNRGYIQGSYPMLMGSAILKGEVNINNSSSFNNLTFAPGADIALQASSVQTVNGTFTATGSRSQLVQISSQTPGTAATISANTLGGATINVDFLYIEDNIIDNGQAGVDEVANNSVDNGGNTGWDFVTNPLVPLDYYWIGGTGNWSDVAHWVTTDGGSTLMNEPPGVVDNVLFTGNSFPNGGTITLDQSAACNNMTWSDGSFNPTIYGNYDSPLYIGGSLTIANGVNRNVERIIFDSRTTNQLVMGDNRFDYSRMEFHGTGIWNMIDSLATNEFSIYGGTLNSNGNALYVENFYLNNDEAITVNFGASKIYSQYISNWSNNVTGDAGTSELILSESGYLQGNMMGFYDITVEGEASFYAPLDIINNLTLKPGAKLMLNPGTSFTIGNLLANGTRPLPVTIQSTQNGTAATLSQLSGTVNASQIVLRDNIATGGATFNATDAYDKGNVTGWNITPIVGQSYYWMVANGDWSDRNSWSLVDGSNTLPATAPGPADNVFVTTNNPSASGVGMNLDIPAECNNMTWSTGVSGSLNGDWQSPITVHGSMILNSGVSINHDNLSFDTDATGNTINFGGASVLEWININFGGTGSWNLADSLYANQLYLRGGTLNLAGYTLNSSYLRMYQDGPVAPVLDLSSSNAYLGTIDANGLITSSTSTVHLANNGNVYDSNNFNDFIIEGNAYLSGSNTYNDLTINPGATVSFGGGSTQTISQLNVVGERSRPITINSTSDGTQATILQSSGVVAGKYLVLRDNNALGGAAFSAQNTIDEGNVAGWNITGITPRNYYWVGGSGKWSEFNVHWANADGGTSFFDASPGPLDNVFFTSNSFPTDGTLEFDFKTFVHDMDWTGSTSNVSITDNGNVNDDISLNISGSLTLANGVSRDIEAIHFTSDSAGETVFMADNLTTRNFIYFDGSGEWNLTGPYTAFYTLLSSGTFNTNNNDVVSDYIQVSNDNQSNWGSSQVSIFRFYQYLDNASTFDAGTSSFNFDLRPESNRMYDSPWSGTGNARFFIVSFDGSTSVEGDFIFYNATGNSGVLSLYGNQAFNSLTMNAGTTLSLKEGSTQTISAALDLFGTDTEPVIVNSTTEGDAGTFSVPSVGVVTADYVHLKDNNATGGANFTATNSSDFGNVTGWSGLKTGQTISFGALNDWVLSAGAFSVGASASSSLAVSFNIIPAGGAATLSGNMVTPTATGLIGIQAIQSGDGTYGSALPVTQFVHIDDGSEPNELGNYKEAKLVLGQPDPFASDDIYTDVTLPGATDVAVEVGTGKVAVANGTRVLIYNQLPTSASTPADVVLGHNDFTTDISGSASASTFSNGVFDVEFAEGKLLVADEARVLIWNTVPTANGTPADVVIGQQDLTSTKDGTSNSQFNTQNGVIAVTAYKDGAQTKLIVTDGGNNRILIFNSIPTVNGAAADVVIGQADFTSSLSGSQANQFNFPIHTAVTPAGELLIADYMNHRVLGFNSVPTTNGASADVVLGQQDFGFNESGTGQWEMYYPTGVGVSRTGKIAVADYRNHRVMIFNNFPSTNAPNADLILGQPDAISNTANNNQISGRSMSYPINVSWDISQNLFVADSRNNRVLVYGAADLEPPVASNANYPTTFVSGQGVTGGVTLSDRSGISSAIVNFRGISVSPSVAYTQTPLLDNGNGTWSLQGDLHPDANNELLGIDYYIEVVDGLGNTMLSGNVYADIQYNNGLPITKFGVGNTTESYRMFSVPLDLANPDAKNVFDEIMTGGTYDNSKFRLFSFPGGTGTSYTEYGSGLTNIDIGKGYFALSSAAATVNSGQGTTRVEGGIFDFDITLVPGWNMIGNPYNFNILWSDVMTNSGLTGAQVAAPVRYDGTSNWPEQTVLANGEGYFVNNPTSSNVTISIPPVYNSAAGRIAGVQENTNSLADDSWEVRFLHQDTEGYDVVLGAVGMEENSIQSFDEHDRINPPPFAEQPKVEFNHPEFFEPSFKKDIRTKSDNEQWSFTYTAKASEDLDEIYWDNSYFGYSSPDIYLVDKTHFEVINMKEVDNYQFEHGGITKFEVYYGDKALEALLPDQLEVQTPYPNPFSEQVKINIGLPKADNEYKVIVAIYNTMGKQVATLTNGAMDSGYYSFRWLGTNDSGYEVPNGIYAYRVMVTGDLSDVVGGKIMKR